MNSWKLLISFLYLIPIYGLRTRDHLHNLLRSNARGRYESDEFYQNQISNRMELLQDNTKLPHFFILQYKSDCGILCHDTIAMKATEFNFIYEIINKDHALIRIELNNMQVLGNNFADLIVDYVPLLSELKIDDDLILDVVCYNQSNIINLHMVFMPLNQEDYDDLLSLISFRPELFPVHFNSSGLFDDLTTQERKIQTILIPLLCQYSQIGLSLFSSLTSIQWIEVRPPMKSSSYWANGILQSGEATINILNEANLTGSNQVIGIADTGIDVNSCYFYDPNVKMVYNKVNQNHRKLIYYDTFANAADDDGHGTLVAGTSAGKCLDSSSDKKNFNGIAPNSKIAFFDIGREDKTLRLPSNLYSNLFLKLYNAGAFIQSMSWGSASNKYTNDARDIDIFMWDKPDSLIFVAAGNDGNNGEGSVGTPATHKNGLAVGASLNSILSFEAYNLIGTYSDGAYDDRSLGSFSSRGPTNDGRLKPEVCGVGYYITGPASGSGSSQTCSTTVDRGTSFAAPLLAGGALLIREYFVSGYYSTGFRNPSHGFIPSGALIKAIMIHSTTSLKYIQYDDGSTESTSIGDNNQGYGRVQLNKGLSFGVNSTLDGLTYFVKGAASKTSEHYAEISSVSKPHVYTFRTLDLPNLDPIRVTLVYTDFYTVSGSSTVLLNDLDVTLSDSTNVYYPEISNSNSNFDRLNPVEIIRLSSPSRNTTYKVTISAHILVKTQPYALVISGNIGQHPFTPPERDYTMYILAGILMMGLITGCVLLCVCCMTKKKKDATKVGARLDDDDDEDEESTHREDDSEIHKHQKHSKHHKHSKHQSNTVQQKTKTTKKIHPEHS